MEFNIDRAEILAAIDKVALATDQKSTNEQFQVMMVGAGKKSARFAASGEFSSVDTRAPADIKTQGSFVAVPSRVRDIAASMPPGRMNISLKGDKVTIKSLVSSRKATFQRHSCELLPVQDPGKSAPWVDVNARELSRALKVVKSASTTDSRSEPTTSLLIPTERGLDVFGCNTYLVALMETSMRMDGKPIQMPESVASVLALMIESDDKARLYCDDSRVFMENADTLVSGLLFNGYRYHGETLNFLLTQIVRNNDSIVGPVIKISQLHEATKSLQSIAGFAADTEKRSYGMQLHAVIGNDTVVLELNLATAEGRNEFDVVKSGAELDFFLSSRFLDQALSSLAGVEEVQALRCDTVLILRSQGVIVGIMEQAKR